MEEVSGMRLLGEQDEGALVALLRAVYGETYAYRALYQPGGVSALIRSGSAALWGDFDPAGELRSHTGFLFKDPKGDYVESGLSLRRPRARPGTPDALVWARLFEWLADRCVLVHQSTSTRHPLAQRYAARYMRARPTGVIVDYVEGERLVGLAHPLTPMPALMMTTVVRPDRLPSSSRPRLLPRGPWGAWLADVLATLGVASAAADAAEVPSAVALADIEHNVGLAIRRRAVIHVPEAPPLEDALAAPAARVDLVHLPCDARMYVFPALERAGFVPVGVRLHATRQDEVVLQRLPGARRRWAMESLEGAELLPPGRRLVEGWRSTCAQIS